MQEQSTIFRTDLTEIAGPGTGTIPMCIYDRASEAGGYVYADQSHYNKLRKLIHRYGGYIAYYIWEDDKGDKEARKGYQQVLSLVKEGKIKVVAIADPARFSRGGHERIQKFELLEKQDCRILRGDTEDYDVPGERRYLEAYVDNEFLRGQARKANDNLPLAVSNGKMPGHLPTGLKRELSLNADKTAVEAVIVHHPVYGPLVQKMVADYISGVSVRQIVDDLNAGEVPNPNAPEGGKWLYTTVYSIFHTYANIGVIKWGRRHAARHIPYSGPVLTVEGKIPPLIDEGTWIELHARLEGRNTGKNINQRGYPAQLLSNVLRCHQCGSKVYIASSMKNGKNYLKYVCAATHRYLTKCDNPSITTRVADQAVIDQVLRLRLQPWSDDTFDAAIRTDPYEPMRIKLRADIAEAQQAMKDHARRVLAQGDMPAEFQEAAREVADEIALKIRHLQDQLASVPHKTHDAVRARDLYEKVASRDIASYVQEAQAQGNVDVLKDIVTTVLQEAVIVERGSASGTSKRTTWARASVTWAPDVALLLQCGALTLAGDVANMPHKTAAELTRERVRRYRQRQEDSACQ